MDDLAALIGHGHHPAGIVRHLMKQTTLQFRCRLVCRSSCCEWIRQIDPFVIPQGVVLGTDVEVVARHGSLRVFQDC